MEKAYAKINIYLKVLGKREDGYHDLESLMVPIDLYDELFFYECDDVIVESDIIDNIVLKAALYLKEKFNVAAGVRIVLKKAIPIGAGLAGGSADCSAALRGLNSFWNLNLSLDELAEISLLFGSDTLFCMYNKPAIIRGRGEKIEFVSLKEQKVLLVNPKFPVITKDIFKEYREDDKGENDLEMALLRLYPEIKEMKREYLEKGIELKLSGSGSTYFAFVEDNFELNKNDKYLEFLQKIQIAY